MKKLGLVLIAFCGTAWGEDPPAEKIPAELRSCVGIERNTERLACYDRGIAALRGTAGASAPTVESSFGLLASTPRPETARGETSDELRSVRGKVAALKSSGGDEIITLDNGQVWRQISGGVLLLKVGDEVTINRAAMGSFQIIVPTGRSGKVKRVR
jgi:hypothetical protein